MARIRAGTLTAWHPPPPGAALARAALGVAFGGVFGQTVVRVLLEFAEFGFGDVEFQFVQLLVQRADLLAIMGRERVEFASDPIRGGGTFIEDCFELGHPRAQGIEIVRGMVRSDEFGHPDNDTDITSSHLTSALAINQS